MDSAACFCFNFLSPAWKVGDINLGLSVRPSFCLSVTLSFPHDISRTLWAFAMKFCIATPYGLKKTPIDFEVKRSKFKVVNLYILSVCNTIISGRYFKKILSLCNVILYQNSLGRLSPLSKCPAPFVLLVFIVLHVAIFSKGACGELLRINRFSADFMFLLHLLELFNKG